MDKAKSFGLIPGNQFITTKFLWVVSLCSELEAWKKNGAHFIDNIFKFMFSNKNCIFIQMQLKFIAMGLINYKSPMDHDIIIASHYTGDKPFIWTYDGLIHWCIKVSLGFRQLTHWGRDQMDAISQTTFLSAFSWMKMFEFRFKFHWSVFLMVQLTIFQHWFR